MNIEDRVAITSRSFSKNKILRENILKKYRHVTFNDEGRCMSGASLIGFLTGHTKAIVGLEVIDEFVLRSLPELNVISKYGVGIDSIDLLALSKYGVELGWSPGVNKRSVSELVICLAIALLRHVLSSNREILDGIWRQKVGSLLSGRTVGVVGCGNIGKDLIEMLQPWGCDFLAHDIIDYEEFYIQNNVKPVSLESLLRNSDVISLHLPLNTSTSNLIGEKELNLVQKGAIIINTSRGGIIDEQSLKVALDSGQIGGAACDVFNCEPPNDFELLNHKNFIASSHIGGSAHEAIMKMGEAAINGLDKYYKENIL